MTSLPSSFDNLCTFPGIHLQKATVEVDVDGTLYFVSWLNGIPFVIFSYKTDGTFWVVPDYEAM